MCMFVLFKLKVYVEKANRAHKKYLARSKYISCIDPGESIAETRAHARKTQVKHTPSMHNAYVLVDYFKIFMRYVFYISLYPPSFRKSDQGKDEVRVKPICKAVRLTNQSQHIPTS
jgi:hypothetical protein